MKNAIPTIPPPELEAVLAGESAPLTSFLYYYPIRNAPKLMPQPDALGVLGFVDDLDTQGLWRQTATTTFLVRGLTLLLDQANALEARHQRAWGGAEHPQRLRPNEAIQPPRDPKTLPLNLQELGALLDEELALCFRLARAGQQYYWARNFLWAGYHQAAAVVLSRVYDILALLLARTDWWYLEVCLRAAFRQIWEELFGLGIPLPSLLRKKPLPRWQERLLLEWMTRAEREARCLARLRKQPYVPPKPPRPFAEVLAAWQAGDLPPPTRGTRMEEARARFWV